MSRSPRSASFSGLVLYFAERPVGFPDARRLPSLSAGEGKALVLEHYEEYRAVVADACKKATSLRELTSVLKDSPRAKTCRKNAREELQGVFDRIAAELALPSVPVYLPVRKKIAVVGLAQHQAGVPKEIRIYPVRGDSRKPYSSWRPRDIECLETAEVFETLLHETAHVLEAHTTGKTGHEEDFVRAYCEVEKVAIALGFAELLRPSLRLTGVPRNSYAAKVVQKRPDDLVRAGSESGAGLRGGAVSLLRWLAVIAGAAVLAYLWKALD